MALALEEGRRGLGLTSPNPPVGAVIVKAGKVLATGYHRRAGSPHAEIEAIGRLRRKAGSARTAAARLRGATMYITLEPCSTVGRTPPCTDALAEAGFSRVVFGTRDPNPGHAGRATRILRARGIEVVPGVLEAECRHLIRMFRKFVLTGTPYVIAKSALTLDGRITRSPGEDRWITGPEARRDVQALRAQVDAILIGGETLRADNPRLTLRGEFARRGRRQPWRVVVSREGRLPRSARLFTDRHRDRTLIFRRKSLEEVLHELGQREITSVLFETGGTLLGEAFRRRLVDEVCFYLAPCIGGGKVRAVAGDGFSCRLRDRSISTVGNDLKVTGIPVYTNIPKKEARA